MDNIRSFSDVFGQNNSGGRSTIYKSDVYSGLVDVEKKRKRKSLRNQRDKYLSAFLRLSAAEKTSEKFRLEFLAAWKQHAEKVYNNIFTFADSNTDVETFKVCNAMSKWMQTSLKK